MVIIDNQVAKKDFAEIAFSPGPGGKQERVVLAVYSGRYDVGSIREGTLDVVADKIDISEIRVLAHTRWYPGWVYAFRQGLSAEATASITSALLKLDYGRSEHKEILRAADITDIVPSKDAQFDPVRELAKTLGMELID